MLMALFGVISLSISFSGVSALPQTDVQYSGKVGSPSDSVPSEKQILSPVKSKEIEGQASG
jgi:hypothetical protein